MEHQPPKEPRADPAQSDQLLSSSRSTQTSGPGAQPPVPALGQLLLAMKSADEGTREAAWEACYVHYWQLVWTRVFYVMRTISWLGEPREIAADVTSDVFVGL